MITQIKQWGNSQGLRLNKQLLSDVALTVGDRVDVKAKNGIITISPTKSPRKKYNLEELLNRIPTDYKATEISWGTSVGEEVW